MWILSRRSLAVGTAIIVVVSCTAIGSYQKLRDLDRADSALYAYGGLLLERGGRLYRDIWDHKPPGVYAVDALAFRLAGEASWRVAVGADTVATLLAVAACVALTWRLTSSVVAASGAGVAAAFYLNLAALHEGGGLAEVYMTACLAWAGWAFVGSRTGERLGLQPPKAVGLLALSGALAGLATLCKPTALTTMAACLVAMGVEMLRCGRRGDMLRQAGVYLAGLAGPPVLVGFLFWRQGSLGEMIDASLLYNFSYVEHGATLQKLWTFHLQHNVLLLAGLAIVLGAGLLRRGQGGPLREGKRAGLRFLLIWLLFEWLGSYAGNFNNGQYLLSCVIPLSCLAGLSAGYLWRTVGLQRGGGRLTGASCVAVSLALAWLPVSDQWRQTVRLVHSRGSGLAMDQIRAAETIRAGCEVGDRVWVWGYAPQVYLAAQRPPATRFVFDGAFLNSGRVMRAEFGEMLEDLERSRPVYIVDAATTGWFAIWLNRPIPQDLSPQAAQYQDQLRQLQAWVARNYIVQEEFGELIVYRRRAEQGVALSAQG